MARAAKTIRDLAIAAAILAGIVFATELWAAERQRAYSYRSFSLITPHDTNITVKGARWIQVTGAGDVVFLHRDSTASDPYPMQPYMTFELGWDHVGVMSTGTTATGIFAYWDLDTTGGPLS